MSTGTESPSEHDEEHQPVPPATPAWVTTALVQRTLAVWQPRYPQKLTVADAVEVLVTVGRLFGVLREGVPHDKAVCSTGARLVT